MRVQAMATGRVVEAGAHHYREDKSPPLSRLLGEEPTLALFLACIEDGSFARISRCRNSRLHTRPTRRLRGRSQSCRREN